MKAPVYVVKPKNIYRHPFNKYDLDKPTSRETQNQDLTDYFNYGFNEDTMNIYAKLVKRNIQALDENANPTYFDAPSQLMRLNDQIPIDFGGFCKFFDTSIFDNENDEEGLQNMQNFHNGEELVQFLIGLVLYNKPEYPLLQFVESLYRNQEKEENPIWDVMEGIQKNLERKYRQVMNKLQQKRNPTQPISHKNEEKTKYEEKKSEREKRKQVSQSESQSDSSDDDSSEDSRQKRRNKRKSRSRQKRRKRSRSKDKRRKSHHKSSSRRDHKKQYKRSRSREKHRKSKDRRKSRDRQRDRERDRERDRKNRHKKRSP